MTTYSIHAAAIEADGLRLSGPRRTANSLRAALACAADRKNHGPEGAAIVVRPSGRIIYSAAEYAAAERRVRRKEEK